MAHMIRKQVYLTAVQDRRLKRAAQRQRRAEAEIIRDALDRQLPEENSLPGSFADDPLFGIVGVGKSGQSSLSHQVDRHLYRRKK